MAGRANRARHRVWTSRRSHYRNSRGVLRRLAVAPTRRPPRCGHGRRDRKCDDRGHHLVVPTQSGPWWRPAWWTGALVTADRRASWCPPLPAIKRVGPSLVGMLYWTGSRQIRTDTVPGDLSRIRAYALRLLS